MLPAGWPAAKTESQTRENLMSLDTLADLFYDEMRDIYSAEKQIEKALPKMIKKASSRDLTRALENHLEETRQQIERLEKAFEDTGKAARAKTCEAMKGLVKEGEETMKEKAEPEVMDAAIICAAQKVEHYEMATYGTLCTWAEQLGYKNALGLLKKNMSEEDQADRKLTDVARMINHAAMV
jgi:ferritin-like metal-binding protein YciE